MRSKSASKKQINAASRRSTGVHFLILILFMLLSFGFDAKDVRKGGEMDF